MTPALLRAWQATDYRIGSARLRIGRRAPAVDALLRGAGAREGVLVTAWNPQARRLPAGWNRRMQARLEARLRRLPHWPAEGVLRGWREAHHLVAADRRRVLVLARHFRQAGVVVLARGQPARLLGLPGPAGACCGGGTRWRSA
jgi:hypothetical protein